MVPRNKILTRSDDQEIASLYLDGLSSGEIHRRFEYKVKQRKSILDSLKRTGVSRRDKSDYVQVNHDAFQEIDSEPAAYFLGLMIADGWVQKKTNEVGIQLNEEDKYILEAFNEWLESPLPLLPTRGMWRMTVRSPYLKKDLAKYGVVSQKTFKAFLPHLDKEWMPHLLRGLLDGDGTVHKAKTGATHIKFAGTYQLCAGVRQVLMRVCGVEQSKISPVHSIYSVCWTDKQQVENIASFLYTGALFFLKRKYLNL